MGEFLSIVVVIFIVVLVAANAKRSGTGAGNGDSEQEHHYDSWEDETSWCRSAPNYNPSLRDEEYKK